MADRAPAPQRPRPSPASAFDIEGVLIKIVQFTPASEDVVSLLTALPAGMRSPALTALLQIESRTDLWPTLRIGNMCDDKMVVQMNAAIGLYPTVSIDGVSLSEHWESEDATFTVPFCGFVKKWAFKITVLRLFGTISPDHREELCRALAYCTHLQTAAPIWTNQVDVLEVVTSTEHCVSELELQRHKEVRDDAIALLRRWLVSGRACHLTLAHFNLPTDAALGRALAPSPTLSRLSLHSSDRVVFGFVAHGVPLVSVEKLEITGESPAIVAGLVALLPALKTLVIRPLLSDPWISEERNDSCNILAALPHLSGLEHLKLRNFHIGNADATRPAIALSSTLKTLNFRFVALSKASLDTLVCWATSSKCLESVTLISIIISDNTNCEATTLQRCIDAGVRRVAFLDCGIASKGLEALAKTLRATHAPFDFELHLEGRMDLVAVRALLEAVATCTNVSVRLGRLRDIDRPEVAEAVAVGVSLDVDPLGDVFLTSPKPTEQ